MIAAAEFDPLLRRFEGHQQVGFGARFALSLRILLVTAIGGRFPSLRFAG
jgi:hypothetical protein